MTNKSLLTVLASITLVLAVVNIFLSLSNQTLQAEVNNRQQLIAQSMQMDALNREVVAVLANIAMKTNDDQIKNLLSAIGVNFGGDPGPAGGAK